MTFAETVVNTLKPDPAAPTPWWHRVYWRRWSLAGVQSRMPRRRRPKKTPLLHPKNENFALSRFSFSGDHDPPNP
jgi:hypothetical protein